MIQSQPATILFEDNHLMIVNKLPSQIVQGDKTGDVPLSQLLKDYIKVRDHKPGNVFLGVVHRLDRPVSGAVMFAKTGKALQRINSMLREGNVHKTYWAIVGKKPDVSEGHLINYLKKNEKQNKSYVRPDNEKDCLRAELKYSVLASSDRYHLLQINLLTGRHHQIRAQLANLGCPIKGDLKYGYPRSNPDASISLHARFLNFIHPVTMSVVNVTAPTPNEKLWNIFNTLIPQHKPENSE
jgi:23S rRNA pseudouridine1911/1915/1917 synthase